MIKLQKEKIEHILNTDATISNSLIEAKYKLPIVEQKILHMLIAQIDFNDKRLKVYSFHVSDFLKIFGDKNYAKQVKKALDTLLNTKVRVTKENSFLETHWLASAEYFVGGKIELEFSEKLKPFLIQLKKEFTKYNIIEINKFKSKFSVRIYLLLKQYRVVGKRTLKIEELKEMLQVSELYPEYRNFKQRVLKVAYKEINALSDLIFEYKEIKVGRKVDSILFLISSKFIQKEEKEPDIDDLIDQLQESIKEPLRIKEYKAILAAAQNDINLITTKYNIAKKQGNIDNLVGWLIKAVETDYSEPTSKRAQSKNKFNDFPQRQYSEEELEELERRLLLKDFEI